MTTRERYVCDRDLTPEQRERFAQYTTPRRALDGRIVWLFDEIGADDDDDE